MPPVNKKRKLLLVAPYGIPLRDFVLNKAVSKYFFEESETDVLSPFTFTNPDEWGFGKHILLTTPSGFRRLPYIVASRIISTKFRASFEDFYTKTRWKSSLKAMMLHNEIGVEPVFNPHRWRLASRLPMSLILAAIDWNTTLQSLPFKRLILDNSYDAVVTSHPTEGASILVSASAKSAGVPVLCVVGGSDNLHSLGPVITNPDLISVWGPEQEEAWMDHQVILRPSLVKTVVRRGGSLLHDQIVDSENDRAQISSVPGVPEGKPLVTFAAFVDTIYPGQTRVCQAILDVFSENQIDGHLLVRVRPGLDDDMWKDFGAKNLTRVTIQIPSGAFFTKWEGQQSVDLENEIRERDIYIATLKRSSLVITAAFSTVYLDAFAADTPVIATGATPSGSPKSILQEVYHLYGDDLKSFAELDFITDLNQLKKKIYTALTSADECKRIMNEARIMYNRQSGTPDGKSGDRVVAAISEFLE